MTRHPTTTIAGCLHSTYLLLATTRANAEIQELVAARGYPEKTLTEGQRLYDAAARAVNSQAAVAGAKRLATVRARAAEREARVAYRDLAQTVRALFRPGSPERAALEVQGSTPSDTIRFLATAMTLFDNALSLEHIASVLARYGYDQQALQRGRDAVLAYQAALQAQAVAKSDAVCATASQRAALAALQSWTAQYIKFAKIALRDRPELLRSLGITGQSRQRARVPAAPAADNGA
jgi:hypothetical protein